MESSRQPRPPEWWLAFFKECAAAGLNPRTGRDAADKQGLSFTLIGGGMFGVTSGRLLRCTPQQRAIVLEAFARVIKTRGQWLPLNEVVAQNSGELSRFLTELDYKPNDIDCAELKFISAFCRAFLSDAPREFFEHPTFIPATKEQEQLPNRLTITREWIEENLPKAMLTRMVGRGTVERREVMSELVDNEIRVEHHPACTWLDLITEVAEQADIDGHAPAVAEKPLFVRGAMVFLGVAYGRAVQHVVSRMYPDLASDSRINMTVLTNRGANAFSRVDGHFNFGVHTCNPFIYVREEHANRLLRELARHISEVLPPALAKKACKMLDPMYDNGCRCRVVFAEKPLTCPKCRGKPAVHEDGCIACWNWGKVGSGMRYEPTALLGPRGMPCALPYTGPFLLQPEIALSLCTGTPPPSAHLTKGGLYDTLLEPTQGEDDAAVAGSKRSVLPSSPRASGKAKRLCRVAGVDPSEDPEGARAVVDAMYSHADVRGSNQMPLTPTSPRFEALDRFFPQLAAVMFACPALAGARVQSAMMHYADQKHSGMPIDIHLKFDIKTSKRTALGLCMNAAVKSSRRSLFASSSDVAGVTGSHNDVTTVAYYIRLSDSDFGGAPSFTQTCRNDRNKASRRSNTTCAEWTRNTGGHSVKVALPARMADGSEAQVKSEELRLRQIIRDFFFEPDKQTEEETDRILREHDKVLLKQYYGPPGSQRKGLTRIGTVLVGPDESYSDKVVALVMREIESRIL